MIKHILYLLLGICSMPALAEMEIIQLHHRTAEQVLPIVRPMLDSGGVASGMDYQLILRSSPENIEQIRQMLDSIDTAPRRLMITVMQDVDSATARRLMQLSASATIGNARIGINGNRGNNGATLSARQGNSRLDAHIEDSDRTISDHKTQQVQVLEGNRALISTGRSSAMPNRQVIQTPTGTRIIETTQYSDANSGFYVLPRIHGNQVTLELSAQNDMQEGDGNEANPALRTQRVQTTLSGRLGEWLPVGDVTQQSQESNSSIGSHSRTSQQEQRQVLLKVEEVE